MPVPVLTVRHRKCDPYGGNESAGICLMRVRLDEFIKRVKRAETPLYSKLKRIAKWGLSLNPPVPSRCIPLLRTVLIASRAIGVVLNRATTTMIRYPFLRAMCASVGPRLYLERLPYVDPSVRVTIGSDVVISGSLSICTASTFQEPELAIGDRVFIGHPTTIYVGSTVVIEDDVLIAGGCSISGYRPHPLNPVLRAAGTPPRLASARRVLIQRNAWIGMRCIILPGVTIGEGAVVGAGAVITKDVPPYSVVVGAASRVLQKDLRSSDE